jgi:hypothetical protein
METPTALVLGYLVTWHQSRFTLVGYSVRHLSTMKRKLGTTLRRGKDQCRSRYQKRQSPIPAVDDNAPARGRQPGPSSCLVDPVGPGGRLEGARGDASRDEGSSRRFRKLHATNLPACRRYEQPPDCRWVRGSGELKRAGISALTLGLW